MAKNGSRDDGGDGGRARRGDLMFVLASAAIFLAIAASVVYFVGKVVF
jgi:hypothetical protein